MTLSVMIVDDEKIDRTAYRRMIERNFDELVVTAEADNGITAIEKSIEQKPDILLLDIKMPGMNGLEVMRFICNCIPDIQILILSAYDYFEYAKEAIRMGVAGYLVKPVSEQELIGELDQIVNKIEEKKQAMLRGLSMAQTVSNIAPAVNRGIFQALRGQDAKMLELMLGVLNRGLDAGYVLIGTSKRQKIEKSSLVEEWKKDDTVIAFGWISNEVFYILMEEKGDSAQLKRRLVRYSREAFKRLGAHLHVTVSECYHNPGELQEQFFETLLVEWRNYKRTTSEKSPLSYGEFRQSCVKLLSFVSRRREEESCELFQELTEAITLQPEEDLKFLQFLFYDIYQCIVRMEARQGAGKSHTDERYDSVETYADFRNEFFRVITNTCDASEKKGVNYTPIVSQILNYMKQNYRKELTLNQVAENLYLSPGYLGKLLKEATGMNFTEYLTGLRIQRAKELLEDTEQSVGEISEAVGYKDPNYFIKVFKKVTDSTPQRYRKKIRWEAQYEQFK